MHKSALKRAAFAAMLKRVAAQVRRRAWRRPDLFVTTDDALELVEAAGFSPSAVTADDLALMFADGWCKTPGQTVTRHWAAKRDGDGQPELGPVWTLEKRGKHA